MALEALATTARDDGARFAFDLHEGEDGAIVLDARPLVRDVARDAARGVATATIARRFHESFADAVVAVCERLRARGAPADVVLSGGAFVNALLAGAIAGRLGARGFRPHAHRDVPPNDGGLALGQLAIAAVCTEEEAR
jgi:hydrogenase maturation protein HypF